jgi:arabinose-5-phosphate isomerase
MREAVLEMATKRGLCSVVDDAMRVKGVITTGDLNRLVEHTEHFFGVPVVEVMNTSPKVVASGTLAYTAYKKMEDHRVIAMPVLDDQDHLIGVIHLHDIMRAGIF